MLGCCTTHIVSSQQDSFPYFCTVEKHNRDTFGVLYCSIIKRRFSLQVSNKVELSLKPFFSCDVSIRIESKIAQEAASKTQNTQNPSKCLDMVWYFNENARTKMKMQGQKWKGKDKNENAGTKRKMQGQKVIPWIATSKSGDQKWLLSLLQIQIWIADFFSIIQTCILCHLLHNHT